jgi:hypothetical protein
MPSYLFIFETGFHYLAQAGLELARKILNKHTLKKAI